MKLVTIITVNFNQRKVTEMLLESIRQHEGYRPLEVIVVDNGSSSNPVPEWRQAYPEVTFIRSEKNLGFAGGNNLGIRQAGGDYLFLVNNDTEFTEGLVARLVEEMENKPQIGLLSPRINYFDRPDLIQYAGYTPMNYLTARNACIGQYETDRGQYNTVAGPTAYAHGAAMMLRREALEEAGPMAENYFLYYEELDWAERIRRAGYGVNVCLEPLIYHKESVSVGKKTALKEYFMNRNRILFIRRNTSTINFVAFMCYFLLLVAPRNILSYVKEGNYAFIPVFFRAIAWHLFHRSDSRELGYTLQP
jgi:GT2 family glycosyltransferase